VEKHYEKQSVFCYQCHRVIGLMIYYDYTFDTFHEDGDRIYRVVTEFSRPEGKDYSSGIVTALKGAIEDNSNFETISEFYTNLTLKVENEEDKLEFEKQKFIVFADQDFFNIFDYKFLAGNKVTVLSAPNSVVLTRERAARYFPKSLPSEIIGKSLVYNDSITTKVTGVVENFEGRTDFIFQEFISHPTILQTQEKVFFLQRNWISTIESSQLLVKVNKENDLEAVQARFDELALEHRSEYEIKYKQTRQFKLQPLNDIHFNEDYSIYDYWNKEGRASKPLLRSLALVALFLLLLGCVNFINLNTAQASQRAKEIGIRKTLGSSKFQLIYQFMGETFLLVLISAILSLLLSAWIIDVFSDFVPEGLGYELFKTPFVIIGIVMLLVAVNFLSGYYPALVLSKFNTVSVLKNHIGVGDKKIKFRKFLTIFQFTIAQVFIIGTLLVGKQINYLLTKDMGFKTEAIVTNRFSFKENELSKKGIYIEKLKAIPEVKNISLGSSVPIEYALRDYINATYIEENKELETELQYVVGDTNYFDLFELELLAGRTYRNDTIKEIVINKNDSWRLV